MKLHIISGLGADERAFQHLDFSGIVIKHLHWIKPNDLESIESYAKRMAEQIEEENPILLGLSFGGMMSVEIAKLIRIKKIILLSSIKTKKEKPGYFNTVKYLKLAKLVPDSFYTKANAATYKYIGANSEEEKKMVDEFMKKSDLHYLKWSIDKILHWENETINAPLVHVHGTADKIFPIEKVKADYVVENAGHLMVMNRAKEVSEIIRKEMC